MLFYFYLLSSLSALTGMRGKTKHDDALHYGGFYSLIHYSYFISLYYYRRLTDLQFLCILQFSSGLLGQNVHSLGFLCVHRIYWC